MRPRKKAKAEDDIVSDKESHRRDQIQNLLPRPMPRCGHRIRYRATAAIESRRNKRRGIESKTEGTGEEIQRGKRGRKREKAKKKTEAQNEKTESSEEEREERGRGVSRCSDEKAWERGAGRTCLSTVRSFSVLSLRTANKHNNHSALSIWGLFLFQPRHRFEWCLVLHHCFHVLTLIPCSLAPVCILLLSSAFGVVTLEFRMSCE